MAAEAASILANLHGQLLREIARGTGRHFQGLRSAATHLRREGLITNKLTKKLARIDDACALNRHVTVISAATLMEELGLCLEPKELPTEVLPNCYSGNQKEWHQSADVRPRAESLGHYDLHIPMAILIAILMTHCSTIFTTIYVDVLLLAFDYLCPVGISARK